jgi:superfamily I DNA/RNA helicase
MFNPSPQQAAVIQWVQHGSGSAVVISVAGSGKTTTIVQSAKVGPPSCYAAFNKKIADEVLEKLQREGIDWKQCKSGTVHSFGFNALRKSFGNAIKVSSYKVADIMKANNDFGLPEYRNVVIRLVSLAKQRAIGIIGKIDDVSLWLAMIDHYDVLDEEDNPQHTAVNDIVSAAIQALKVSNQITEVIDFDDMVYLPVLLGCKFWRYSMVYVDEAQDTNLSRRALIRALLMPGGRLMAVGDDRQAIYGFTGADNDALDQIIDEFDAICLPLTVSFRCPKKVVAFAHQWVSHIEAHESAIEGSVSSQDWKEFVHRTDLNGDSAVLCRNTKPLVVAAFALIRRKIACRIEGRDIGTQLSKLATHWKQATTLNNLTAKLIDYRDSEVKKAMDKRQEPRAQMIADQVSTLLVIIDACREAGKNSTTDVVNFIDELFADDIRGMLTLSTIHKSKGREWKNVFWLNRHDTCPSFYARQEWQKNQERNLMYVAATRAMENLIDLHLEIPRDTPIDYNA